MGKKNKKMFLLSALVMLCVIPAFALLKTGVFGNEKNFLASDGNARYDIVADLDGGKFEVSAKPEFVKMDNGKWLYKYKPSAKPVTVPTPVKEGYEFTGWTVGDNQTLQLEYSIPVWNKKNINLKAHWRASESILVSGETFNSLFRYTRDWESITEIKFIKGNPDPNGVDLSDLQDGSITGKRVGNVYEVSCAGTMYANPDCERMFFRLGRSSYNKTMLSAITFENFNTSKVTNMREMFDIIEVNEMDGNLKYINGLNKFDTSNVTDMCNMFRSCSLVKDIDVSSFDTSKVTNMFCMFKGCESVETLDVSSFDTSKVINMAGMFSVKWVDGSTEFGKPMGLKSIKGINNFDLSSAKRLDAMFSGCNTLQELDLSGFNLSNVDSTANMFDGCWELKTINGLEKFDFSSVTNASMMFQFCENLSGEITIPGVITTYNQMFHGCSSNHNTQFIVKYTQASKDFVKELLKPDLNNRTKHVYLYEDAYTLRSGKEFNAKIKAIPEFNIVKHIKFIKNSPTGGVNLGEDNYNVDKDPGLDLPTPIADKCLGCAIKGNIEGDTLYISAVGNGNIIANPDCSGMFEGMSNIESITFENFDTSNVTNMSRMFAGCGLDPTNPDPANPDSCGLRTINGLDKFNTSKVANMDRMFAGCNSLKTLNLSNFDTSKVTNMDRMFTYCNNLSKIVGLENLNIQNVNIADDMFSECHNLSGEITFTNPNMKINHIFDSCSTNKGTMFIVKYENSCKTLAQNATKQVGSIQYRHVYLYGEDYMLDDGDTFNQVIKSIPNFDKVKHIKFVKGSPTTGEHVGRRHASCDMNVKNTNPTEPPEPPTEPPTGPTDHLPNDFNPNYLQIICSKCAVRGNIEGDILYISAVAEGNIYASNENGSMINMFKDMPNIETITFDNFNTSEVYNMSNAFAGCTNLQSLDLSNFNTAKVKNMSGVFENCSNLETINLNNINMAKVTDTSRMFKDCSKLSGEMTIDKNIASYQEMFLGCSSNSNAEFWVKYISPETKNVAKNMVATKREGIDHVYLWDPSSILLPGLEFQAEVKKLNLPDTVVRLAFIRGIPSNLRDFKTIDVSNAKDNSILAYIDGDTLYVASDGKIMANEDSSYLFAGAKIDGEEVNYLNFVNFTNLTFDNLDTSNVTNMTGMFLGTGLSSLQSIDISNFDTSNVTDMSCMFYGCSKLISLDLSNFDTSQVTSMRSMFDFCISLTSLDVSNFNTSNVTNMSYMFVGCISLTSLDVSNFNTSNVTDMSYMFSMETYSNNLTDIKGLENFDTSKVTDMNNMFYYCRLLTSLDVSNFNTSNVTNMSCMFRDCDSLTSLDVSSFDTSKVTDMRFMFKSCSSLTSLNVSSFDTSKVTDMGHMFRYCSSLTNLDISNFDTSNVTTMVEMFNDCNLLASLDLSNFNTSQVKDMALMFYECSKLTSIKGIENFDVSQVTDMDNMFYNCWRLTSLDLSKWDTSNVTNMSNMFLSCNNLSGEITIMNPNITYTYMFRECSINSPAKFIVNYKPDCKDIAQKIVATKSYNSDVVLGVEMQSVLNNKLGSVGVQKYTTYEESAATPKPVKLTLINGPSAQYPKQVIQITNNKIPNLNAPDINPLYAGQFGGYYYDEQFTKPVKQGDIITRDLTIYASW